MTDPLPKMTVGQLRAALSIYEDDLEVKVWLPGTTIKLACTFRSDRHQAVCIEGNSEPGSALDKLSGG